MQSEVPNAVEAGAALEWAHPLVRGWFVQKFGSATEPQVQGWPEILAGRATLISAPTGSGKTLAAFLACIDRLVRKAVAGDLQDRTEVVYISPLKALGNDIQRNLEGPLGEILALAGERGLLMPEIRTAVRTGDTLMHERQKMLRRPPHILVTTPESLYILLTAEKSRAMLRDVETVIVDEIHAVADDKRGSHLAISLERLELLAKTPPVRIGLSATQRPIEVVAEFLVGAGRPLPAIVDIGHRRRLDLAIEVPKDFELGPVASNEMWAGIYDRIAELVREHRSTLVFVNTRRLAERLAHNLIERLGEDAVAAHHGSLSRKLRMQAERRLKSGELKVVVATGSLELGIDVGFVDLVCHVGSPKAIAVMLQRVGRAGHWKGAVPKGRIFVTTRDEMMECAATVRAIRHGELDRLMIPDTPLDILAQQMVAMCAAEEWNEDELFRVLRRAFPYRELSRENYNDLLEMVSEGISTRRGRFGAYLYRDQVNRRLKARRGARMMAITSGGAIPENGLFTVVAEPEGVVVGTLDEDFAVESLAGDIVLLGNTSWKIRRIESASSRILVEDAHGQPPGIPFWLGEAPARTAELSKAVSDLREEISERVPEVKPHTFAQHQQQVEAAKQFLKDACGLDDWGAYQAIRYVVEGRTILGAVPTGQTIIAERFFDEGGGMQLVLHAPFGSRINKAWGLALRKRFCRSFNFELQAAATENGINISLAEQHSFPLSDVFNFLSVETVEEVLVQAVLTGSPIFNTRFRWDATRALALLRFRGGKKVPPNIQRMLADDLLATVFPDVAACGENIEGDIQVPDHPLIREVMKDVLHEAMDIDGLKRVIDDVISGRIKTISVDTPLPSVFSHEILNANPYAYLDDAPLEERRARAVEMRRVLPEGVLEEVGMLDPEAIAEVREQARPDVRDADELHDALLTLVAVPSHESKVPSEWPFYFDALARDHRAVKAKVDERNYWVASERIKSFRQVFPEAVLEREVPEIGIEAASREDAVLLTVQGWMLHSGPVAVGALASTLGVPTRDVEAAMLRLEAGGTVLRGRYTSETEETEWCERRLLARIHRLTVARLRKQIEPVMAADYMHWLLGWQHVAPGAQTAGERGLLEVLSQLQGFEIPANAWEREVLSRRVAEYDPAALDNLCLTGAIGWGRLSPHPATLEKSEGARRVIPTSVAPITFFVREECDWMLAPQRAKYGHAGDPALPRHENPDEIRGLGAGARDVLGFLRQRGASFFADIVRGTGKLKAEIETALWELVAAGLVTADGFDNLRALIDPKRRAGHGHGKSSRPRHSSGRWSLLYAGGEADRDKAIEATCWMLLKRYGVVFRELMARETLSVPWRELLFAFRRLEARGEIRGGRFITGFMGEQFALPVAVESLRASRNAPRTGETVRVSAADPVNLVGIILPGERVPAISGRYVAFRDGIPIQEEPPAALHVAGD